MNFSSFLTLPKKKRVVVLGGGTGTFVVLSGLKKYYQQIEIVAIIDVTDSGGSNKKLIDEFGLLPTSDIKQCLVALSPETAKLSTLRQLFNYRFTQGEGIKGQHFGNLFMAALADILGSQKAAIEKTQEILKIRGRIVPVSYEKCDLVADYSDGSRIVGEHEIDEPTNSNLKKRIVKLSTLPSVSANPEAIATIQNADLIILAPGDLFTSLLANLVVDGVAEEIRRSKAKKLYVVNLMTKVGQTTGFSAARHVDEVEKYLGKTVDFVLINNKPIPEEAVVRYAQEEEQVVIDDLKKGKYRFQVIRADLLNPKVMEKSSVDSLKRSLIRHDSDKLAQKIISLL